MWEDELISIPSFSFLLSLLFFLFSFFFFCFFSLFLPFLLLFWPPSVSFILFLLVFYTTPSPSHSSIFFILILIFFFSFKKKRKKERGWRFSFSFFSFLRHFIIPPLIKSSILLFHPFLSLFLSSFSLFSFLKCLFPAFFFSPLFHPWYFYAFLSLFCPEN